MDTSAKSEQADKRQFRSVQEKLRIVELANGPAESFAAVALRNGLKANLVFGWRKFFDLHAANVSPVTAEALKHIGDLYAIEGEIRGNPPDERRALRRARTGPAPEALHTWLHEQLAKVAKKSEFDGAVRYALSRWTALTRNRDDGRIEIDNNAAERSLRTVALGRKNWLLTGSDDGGDRAAAIYSFLSTAQLNGLNTEAYLRFLFERLPEHPINRIEELLLWAIVDQLPDLKLADWPDDNVSRPDAYIGTIFAFILLAAAFALSTCLVPSIEVDSIRLSERK